ncbi:MAG: diguanylate cyclase [Planctomycetes bacterium]|nr:diguanylate cyclase [Planctomycetota bacterium]
MKLLACDQSSNAVRVGAAGAVAAVTMLWVGTMSAPFFQAGTVLLVLCLIPLARGLGARGGAITGLLLSLVWVAARLGFAPSVEADMLFSELNVLVVAAMMTIGGLAGVLLCPPISVSPRQSLPAVAGGSASVDDHPHRPGELGTGGERRRAGMPAPHETRCGEDLWGRALARHREWLAGWDRVSYPWASFDSHIRDLVRLLTGMQRLRCYRVADNGQLYPLSSEHPNEAIEPPSRELLDHVLMTGRRFVSQAASTAPLVQTLADSAEVPLVWAVPIRDGNVPIGLVTAQTPADGIFHEERLQTAADLVEELWLHVHHVDSLRRARQTDRGSGLINRTDFLPAFKTTLEQCYKLREPVVVMVVCLEGLRGLDDASRWAKRDELIERVGHTIASGLRRDDLVGRFSDAQFVAMLRRLDIPLAELIGRKLLGSIAKEIADFGLTSWVTPRGGLSGSGFKQVPAETLLKHATSALHQARTQDLLLISEPPGEGTSANSVEPSSTPSSTLSSTPSAQTEGSARTEGRIET